MNNCFIQKIAASVSAENPVKVLQYKEYNVSLTANTLGKLEIPVNIKRGETFKIKVSGQNLVSANSMNIRPYYKASPDSSGATLKQYRLDEYVSIVAPEDIVMLYIGFPAAMITANTTANVSAGIGINSSVILGTPAYTKTEELNGVSANSVVFSNVAEGGYYVQFVAGDGVTFTSTVGLTKDSTYIRDVSTDGSLSTTCGPANSMSFYISTNKYTGTGSVTINLYKIE